jgi:hypothetical protein
MNIKPTPEIVKAAWEQYREFADLTARPVLQIAGLSLFDLLFNPDVSIEEPEVITFEVITYGQKVVVEADGVIVEILCDPK